MTAKVSGEDTVGGVIERRGDEVLGWKSWVGWSMKSTCPAQSSTIMCSVHLSANENERERQREREREREGEGERQRDRETERERDRETETERDREI